MAKRTSGEDLKAFITRLAQKKRSVSGGKARAATLTPAQRSEIARKGARARWDKMTAEERVAHRSTWANAKKEKGNA